MAKTGSVVTLQALHDLGEVVRTEQRFNPDRLQWEVFAETKRGNYWVPCGDCPEQVAQIGKGNGGQR